MAWSRGRWVCPDDRQLKFRARLNKGWSQKTKSFECLWPHYSNTTVTRGTQQPYLLTENERQMIIQVIQRDEALDLSEQKRVGRLVERLKNVKQNVLSATSRQRSGCGIRCRVNGRCVCSCGLCGDRFGTVLGASGNLCKDCRKYVCQKCGIEITKPNPLEGSDSADGEGSKVPMRGSFRFLQEQAMVFRQRIIQWSHGNAHRKYLCLICAETREIWMRSGGWFFKSMPKFIPPKKKERGWTSTWAIGRQNKSSESTDQQDSSSDDETGGGLSMARGRPISPTNLPCNRTPIKSTISSPVPSSISSPSTPRGKPSGSSPLGHRENGPDRLSKPCLSQGGQLSPTGSKGTLRSTASGRSPLQQRVSFVDDEKDNEAEVDLQEEAVEEASKNVPVHLNRSKGPKVQSLRIRTPTATTSVEQSRETDWHLEVNAERDASKPCQDQDSSSSDTHRNSQVVSPKIQTPEYPQETGQDYGTLEVFLRYDPADQCLRCRVECANGLIPMDIEGLADPFCKLNILPVKKATMSKLVRTRAVHRTLNPEFHQTVNFNRTTEADIASKALHVLISQEDPFGEDFLGEARFPLHELRPYETRHYKVSLQQHYQVDNEEDTWGMCLSCRGVIQVSLNYCTRRRALLVTVHRVANLLPMGKDELSDPFVKLALVENANDKLRQQLSDSSTARATVKRVSGKKKVERSPQCTSIKRKTMNPEWNEEFSFVTASTELTRLTLCLSVWDKVFLKRNNYMGGLMLGCGSKGARLQHWIDTINTPDHRHLAWHNLAKINVPME
ncbi:PREDICTED: rabphilin-3A-like isoform X2 [Dinoponera quadriceps]|uniref:Rabphilin-3A-like isoform X2 n=1 Tax=Dinoponera quadriceps TaxID=609295 RepID=A0A6P3XJN6_DINQU|nr:PREDICTED: rabphilin-3A-like isoform X2 [Dinoponera quadriceps]